MLLLLFLYFIFFILNLRKGLMTNSLTFPVKSVFLLCWYKYTRNTTLLIIVGVKFHFYGIPTLLKRVVLWLPLHVDGSHTWAAVSLFTSPAGQQAHRQADTWHRGTASRRHLCHWDEAQSTYYHRWMSFTLDLLGRWEDRWGESQLLFLDPKLCLCFVSSEEPSSVLAALISQPVQAELKLIWKSPMERQKHEDTKKERWCRACGCTHWASFSRYMLLLPSSNSNRGSETFWQNVSAKMNIIKFRSKQEITQ